MHISVEILRKTIKKLKLWKGSSDGITVEILRESDESNLEAMAAALNDLFLHSELPQTWSEITATLVPKLGSPVWTQRFQTNRSIGHSPKVGGIPVAALCCVTNPTSSG